MKVDCLIVGAGQAGLSLAALLKEKNIDVLVLGAINGSVMFGVDGQIV